MRYLQAIDEQNRRCRSRQVPLISLLGILTALTLFACHPTTASATCGDYLSHGYMLTPIAVRGQAGFAIHERIDSTAAALTDDDVATRTNHRTEPFPCRGPYCKRAPSHTPHPNPIVSLDHQDRWLVVVTLAVQPSGDATYIGIEGERLPLSLFEFRLERPPKQA